MRRTIHSLPRAEIDPDRGRARRSRGAVRVAAAAFAGCLAAGLAACGSNSPSTVTVGGKTLQNVTLMLDWIPNPDHVGIYYALDHGYFKRAGLNVKVQVPGEGNAAQFVGSNRDDLGISWPSGMFAATLAGIPITVVAATMPQTADVVIISPKSGIKTLKGLAGHSIGYFSPEGKTTAEYVMAHNGVNPSKVSYVDVGTTLVQALLSGKVTAMTGGLANVEAIQTRLAFHEQEPVFTLSSEGFPPYPEFTLVANTNRLKDPAYAKMVRTFITALIAGEKAAEANPAGAQAILKKVTQYTPQFLTLSTPESLKLIEPSAGAGWDCLNIPQLQTLANFMTSEKIITGHVDVSKEATNAYNAAC
jgi:putative hydroxymethylpyrimidine transport system substrate-binding protein